VSTNDELVVHLKRVLPANRADVYQALTDPETLAKWWGPRGFVIPEVDFEPQVGGSYRLAMQPPEGDLFYLSGEFREVEPSVRLAFTFQWDPPVPDDRVTLATLSLRSRGPTTEVELTQTGFATEERRALHEAGWTDSLARLAEVLREIAH
jgi:uncharacterized protein YndB with AHSA1/START domain